jgi:hypothetical protein
VDAKAAESIWLAFAFAFAFDALRASRRSTAVGKNGLNIPPTDVVMG